MSWKYTNGRTVNASTMRGPGDFSPPDELLADTQCSVCGDWFPTIEMGCYTRNDGVNESWVCQHCESDSVGRCSHCDDPMMLEDLTDCDGELLCGDCTYECEDCGKRYDCDDDDTSWDRHLCPECIAELPYPDDVELPRDARPV